MKATKLAIAAIVAAMILPAAAMGQGAAASPTSAPKPKLPTGFLNMPGGGYGTYEDMFKVCEPDEHQIHKLVEIEARRVATLKDKEKELEEAQKAFINAWVSKDKDAIEKAQKPYGELSQAVQAAAEKTKTEVLEVLTPKQMAAWREYVAVNAMKNLYYSGVKFSDEQLDKIMAAYEKLAKDSAVDPNSIINKLSAQVNAILTPEQKAKRVMSSRYAQMDAICHFTPEQIVKLVKIEDDRTKAMADLQDEITPKTTQLAAAMQAEAAAGRPRAVEAIQKQYNELYQSYYTLHTQYNEKAEAIMTDTQKKDWKEDQKKQQERWSKHGGGAPGGGLVIPLPGAWKGQ